MDSELVVAGQLMSGVGDVGGGGGGGGIGMIINLNCCSVPSPMQQ